MKGAELYSPKPLLQLIQVHSAVNDCNFMKLNFIRQATVLQLNSGAE